MATTTKLQLNSKTKNALYIVFAIAAPVVLLFVGDAWVWTLDRVEELTGTAGGDLIPLYSCLFGTGWLLAVRQISKMKPKPKAPTN